MRKLSSVLMFVLCLAGSGCGPGRVYIKAYDGFEKQLDSEIGRLSFADALERWERPSRIDQGKKALTVFWENYEGETLSPLAPYSAEPTDSSHAWVFAPKGWRLILAFDKTTERLQSWKYSDW